MQRTRGWRRGATGLAAAALLLPLAGTVPAVAAPAPPTPAPPPPASAAPAAAVPAAAPATAPALVGAAPVVQPGPDGDAALVTDTPTGPPNPTRAPADPVVAALAHARMWARDFGAIGGDFAVVGRTPLAGGRTVVRLQQLLDGVPVHAGELVVVVDATGRLLTLSGGGTTRPAVFSWRVTRTTAAATARSAAARRAGVPAAQLRATTAERVVYDPSLIGAPSGPARTAWRVSVDDLRAGDGGAQVVVDAVTGRVLHTESRGHGLLDRVVCDGRNLRASFDAGICRSAAAARREGQGPVGATPTVEVDRAYDILGSTSDFFATLGVDLTRLIGYDARDGRGPQLRATVRYCPPADVDTCPMVNAFWLDAVDGSWPYTGGSMYVGQGLAGADDVVAHELTHGVTAATSRLVYSYEAGAINESMSDVFGELVDQLHIEPSENPAVEAQWLIGEGLAMGPVRSMSDPTRSFLGQPHQPDRMGSPYWWTKPDDEGGVHVNSGVGNKAAYLIAEGGAFNGRTVRGLGVMKTARLYWEVENRLAPGATYAVLGGQLRQACSELAAAAVEGFAADDCVQVAAAVDATEMTIQRVRMAPAATLVRYGSTVTVTARVTDAVQVGSLRGLSAAAVELQRRASASAPWVAVGTTAADRTGTARFTFRAAATAEYRAQVVGRGVWTPATTPAVRVRVAAAVSAARNGSTVLRGRPLVVSGSSWPRRADSAVVLQRRGTDGRWQAVASARLDSASQYRLVWRPGGSPGVAVLRVMRPSPSSTVVAGATGAFTVRIR